MAKRKKAKQLIVNEGAAIDRRLVQCSTVVNKKAVRREVIDGVEHIIVSSYTLPDNIVMNGGLYPADEINKSYQSLERTLAPVEHPTDADGNFISANDPTAIHNFHAGAFNVNVRKDDGRIHVEKHVNVQEALKTERGKRLIERIEEIETNENPRPIHTSTGVFVEVEKLDKPLTNDDGLEYSWIATNMIFDHDAILLDSVGAAQPHQGVGMAVNTEGDKVEVERIEIKTQSEEVESTPSTPSLLNIKEQLEKLLTDSVGAQWLMIADLVGDQCIFETNDGFYMVPYRIDGETARIVGIPIRADKKTTYTPKVNEEGDAMKELMLKALADAGIAVNADMSDEEIMAAYAKLQANQSQGDDDSGSASDDVATVVANAVAKAIEPISTELASLKTEIQANAEGERDGYVEVIVNSDKYAGIDEETAKLLPLAKLKEMAANCGSGHGLLHGNNDEQSGYKSTEVPE